MSRLRESLIAPDAVSTGGNPDRASGYTCRNTVELINPFQLGLQRHESRGHEQDGRRFKART